MRTLHRQRGLSGIGWLAVLALIAGTVLVALRLIPPYLENFSISSVLEDVQSGEGYTTSGELRSTIMKRFNINSVDRVDRRDIVITRQGRSFVVDVDYEVRVPLVGNIDFLLTFENQARVPVG